jgi:hypothetical protein
MKQRSLTWLLVVPFLLSPGCASTPRQGAAPTGLMNAIGGDDISLGMSEDEVIERRGDPNLREAAGDADRGDDRWTYSHWVPDDRGYHKELSVFYFEKHHVVGWKRQEL